MLSRIWKPWYVWRPTRLFWRAIRRWRRLAPGYRPLPLAWGLSILADPTKPIGRSIWTTGIYDLAVSEVFARLVQPGDIVVDAGANIGYMTLLAATVSGESGTVISFEPHPELFIVLQQNVAMASRSRPIARMLLRNTALGDRTGQADLILPEGFSCDDGLAYIRRDGLPGSRSIPVGMETLDEAVGARPIAVLKLDVEGHELQALRGAKRALESRRIRHIVFEDHQGRGSAVVRFLESFGYRVYSIGWSVKGPRLAPIEGGRLAADYEAPSYLATLEPNEAQERCARAGWRVLSAR
jgi:FkbM family methyltransferase